MSGIIWIRMWMLGRMSRSHRVLSLEIYFLFDLVIETGIGWISTNINEQV
jgi:hypothetical protein